MMEHMTINLAERIEALKAQQGVSTPAGSDLNSVAPAKPAVSVRGGTKTIPNRYGGTCVRCNVWVEDHLGQINKVAGRWLVTHIGECPDPVFPPRDFTPGPSVASDYNPVRHGIYTVNGGDEGHATFKIWHQDDDADFAPGKDIIGVMLGSDNTRYTSIGFVRDGRVTLFRKNVGQNKWWESSLNELIADPEVALESLKCRRCNRDLTNPESLETGIGPECAKHE
jgi:hypothetical protein